MRGPLVLLALGPAVGRAPFPLLPRVLVAGHEVTTGLLWVMGYGLWKLLRQKFPYKLLFLLQLPFALPVGPTPVPRLPLLAISVCPPGRPLESYGSYGCWQCLISW